MESAKALVCAVTVCFLAGCSDTVEKIAYTAGRSVMRIDATRCVACGNCMGACPQGAIREVTVEGTVVYVIDPEKCTACGNCRQACRVNAITLVNY